MEVSFGSYKFRLEIVLLIIILFWIMFGHLLCGCCRVNMFEGLTNQTDGDNKKDEDKKKEGFTGTLMGPEFSQAQSPGYIMNPSNWSMPTLTYSPGTTPDAGVQAILNRPKQPIPLPEGQLDMFATTKFKPECCPNAYSSSMGCACMTMGQYDYLRQRGSNNVPYDIY